ncbi:MAG: alcohol dehydrogenase catalytic domain-containing protein [Candidatus Binataceae bacterium]|nr:alcohol dehydrogenase catalytic domain-containing protein [Candidatus Binataceae bacterium]
MSAQVRAAVLEAPDKISIKRFALPEISEDTGLLRVEMAGICHTDVGLYHGTVKYAEYPLILGHEILGRIEQLGPIAQRRWGVRKGDRVVVEAMVRCGFCRHCIDGNYKFCEGNVGYGTNISAAVPPHLWGSYAEYMHLAPGTQVYKIPDDLPVERAILLNVAMANAIQWTILKGGLQLGDVVLIQGVGPIGLACIAVAREAGAKTIIASGRSSDRNRLELAKRFSADVVVNIDEQDLTKIVKDASDGRLADVVVDVTGAPAAVAKSIELVRPQGTVVNAGVTGDKTETPLRLDQFLYKEINFRGVFTSSAQAMRMALAFDPHRKYPFEEVVSDRYPLSRAEDAVKAAGRELGNPNTIKVTITPD